MGPADELDAHIRLAVSKAARELAPRDGEAGEAALRQALVDALRSDVEGVVEIERAVAIPEFQGVGGVDVLLRAGPTSAPWGLIECKWSVDRRDKIFEAAWDAIKLALAARASDCHAWLVTGAPLTSWDRTETPDLFSSGVIDTQELWSRELYAPGPNGGLTVGDDCRLGGRGNMFTHAHRELVITGVHACRIGKHWGIRAARVAGRGALVQFAEKPEFPARIDQAWLDAHVPCMDEAVFARLLTRLRDKRWTARDIATRVAPLRCVDDGRGGA